MPNKKYDQGIYFNRLFDYINEKWLFNTATESAMSFFEAEGIGKDEVILQRV